MKYRKRPIVIDAVQYEPDKGIEDGYESLPPPVTGVNTIAAVLIRRPYIDTLEGRLYISSGDWIITGVKGERYPCKDDIFRATYEPLEEETPDGA